MRARLVVSMLGVLLSVTTAYSTTRTGHVALLWEFPKRYGTPAWNFTVVRTYQGKTAQAQVTLPALDDKACQQLAGKEHTPDTWCALLPCPEPGAYSISLQAHESEPSNVARIGIGQGPPCRPIPFDEALQTPPRRPPKASKPARPKARRSQ